MKRDVFSVTRFKTSSTLTDTKTTKPRLNDPSPINPSKFPFQHNKIQPIFTYVHKGGVIFHNIYLFFYDQLWLVCCHPSRVETEQ